MIEEFKTDISAKYHEKQVEFFKTTYHLTDTAAEAMFEESLLDEVEAAMANGTLKLPRDPK